MSGRDAVLARIGRALQRPETQKQLNVADQPESVSQRLLGQHSHTLPRIPEDTVSTLIANMESVLMSVVRLQTERECVGAVQWYLESENIDISDGRSVTVAPALGEHDWPEGYATGAATGLEKVSVTPCIAVIAETGSVVTMSGANTPATLNFLPETHIVIAHESDIVKHPEDVFALLRQQAILPRAVNFITGPSRTADIEQTLEIGAHGPKRMHVILISSEKQGVNKS